MTVKGLRLVEIRQSSEAPAIADVSLAVREQVRKLLRRRNLPPGSRVAITAGSRGVRDAVESIKDAALERLPVLGGLAVVNNARERTASDEGLATRASLSGVLSNLCQKSRAMNAALHLRLHLSCKTRGIYGALGRTRTCDLLIRRPNRAVLCGSLKCVKGDSWAL